MNNISSFFGSLDVGALHGDARTYGSNPSTDGSWTQPAHVPPPRLELRDAIAKAKQEGLRGLAAVGRVCSLTGDSDVVSVEMRLREEDRSTRGSQGRVFALRDNGGAHLFFAAAPPRDESTMTAEQRRAEYINRYARPGCSGR